MKDKPTKKLQHYLLSAKYLRNKADYLSEKMEKQRSRAEKMTASFQDVPVFGSYEDHRQSVIEEMVDTQKQYAEIIQRCKKKLQEIQLFIDNLENYQERAVMELRYIYFEEWPGVALIMGYTERQIFNIHGNALLHLLEIHEKIIENGKRLF